MGANIAPQTRASPAPSGNSHWNAGPPGGVDTTAEGSAAERVPMSRPEDYRGFAARCLEIERHTDDVQTQALMLRMAQICQRLAEELDAAPRDECAGTDQDGAERTDAGAAGT